MASTCSFPDPEVMRERRVMYRYHPSEGEPMLGFSTKFVGKGDDASVRAALQAKHGPKAVIVSWHY